MVSGRSEDFKVTFVDGAYTWLGAETGTISFFYDLVGDPVTDRVGNLNLETGKRIFPIEIRLRKSSYALLAQFMNEQLKMVENLEKTEKNKTKPGIHGKT